VREKMGRLACRGDRSKRKRVSPHQSQSPRGGFRKIQI
jgi:hypothetical protein